MGRKENWKHGGNASSATGHKNRINTGRDQSYMEKYLSKVSRSSLDKPDLLQTQEFLPMEAPLLDFLVVDAKKIDGGKYPQLKELEKFQGAED